MSQRIFEALYKSGTEDEVDKVIDKNLEFFKNGNWKPLGGDENYFGIVRGQQASSIAALVEKLTNSMDAILIRKCLEAGIEPTSPLAPKSMDDAIAAFFPDHKNWDLTANRRTQSEEIQILADGKPRDVSVIIYDNGEGQHPEKFEDTFLSLVRGNKIKIQFVQGKYNMGGSGALVFCGKKGYQLVGSKRYDGTGNFGFTLIRYRKIDEKNESQRHGYFEYLVVDGKIPTFPISEMDLGLWKRKFKTGTILKLYSYQFPSGYYGFAQDLNQSLNEFLFQPVLPMYTIESDKRYPNNKVNQLDLFGLKRRLEEGDNDYLEHKFTEEYEDQLFGKSKVTCYIFKPKLKNRDAKESRKNIRDRYFKNDMSVLFSINGQVHGHFTSEFITRTLKLNLLKDHLLIHVDCTTMDPNFRNELFMSSRDRLKIGDETKALREYLGKKLIKSELDEINRRRKDAIGFESEDLTDLIKNFAKNIPKDSDLFKLLQNTLKIDEKKKNEPKPTEKKNEQKEDKAPFQPRRFPSYIKYHNKKDGNIPVVSIPLGGEKTLKFDTDVENEYFDRSDEPGTLQIGLLNTANNNAEGGNAAGDPKGVSALFGVTKSSPNDGQIKITLSPNKDMKVGDQVQIKVTMSGTGIDHEELVLVKITEPEAPKETTPKIEEDDIANMGLPKCEKIDESKWSILEEQGIAMSRSNVMYPVAEGDILTTVYVNLDSDVFLNHRKKLKTADQIEVAQRKYVASVYFHTIFLYMITKKKKYSIQEPGSDGDPKDVEISDYIRDLFDSFYSEFLLNFGMEELMGVIGE